MEGVYLDGNLKLKKPTYTNLIYLGDLLDKHNLAVIVKNKKIAIEILNKLCTKTKGADLKGKLNSIIVARVMVDFLSKYSESIGVNG